LAKVLLNAGSSGRYGWSSRQHVMRCAARHGFAQTPGPTVSDALIRGSLVHVGLAHHYAQLQAVQQAWDPHRYYEPGDAIRLTAEAGDARDGLGKWEPWIEPAQAAVRNHQQLMALQRASVVAVEQLVHFEVPWRHPRTGVERVFPASMRLDLVLTDDLGRWWIVDHKSCVYAGGNKKKGFMLYGGLVGMQWWAQRAWGERFGGLLISLLTLAGDGSKTPYRLKIERFTPEVAPMAIKTFPDTVAWSELQRELLEATWGTENPDNYPRALSEQGPCVDRYGLCEYRERCRWGGTSSWGSDG
jgi:hypothetical protein